jgi:hypothetical protein
MSSKVYPFGKVEVLVAALAKIAAWSKAPYTIKYKAGFPNLPDAWVLLKSGAADEEYSSAAFAAATLVRIEANASEVIYGQGVDEVVLEKRQFQNQPAPIALDATGVLTSAMIASGIITSAAAAVTATTETGAQIDAALQMQIGESVDFSIIKVGANSLTVAAGATGVTTIGSLVVATATSAIFRLRKTAAQTFILYRIS